MEEPYQGVGCFTRQKVWDPGVNYGCPGTEPIEHPEWFLHGIPQDELLKPPPAPCCPPVTPAGLLQCGLGLGGRSVSAGYPWRIGIAFGGAQRLYRFPAGISIGFKIPPPYRGLFGLSLGAQVRVYPFSSGRAGLMFGARFRDEHRVSFGLNLGTRVLTSGFGLEIFAAGIGFGGRMLVPRSATCGFSLGAKAIQAGVARCGFSLGANCGTDWRGAQAAGLQLGAQGLSAKPNAQLGVGLGAQTKAPVPDAQFGFALGCKFV